MKAEIKEFAPKDLPRIIATAAATPGVHPNLDDLEDMARDTIAGSASFTACPEQAAAAHGTIRDVQAAKEKSACPSTKKP